MQREREARDYPVHSGSPFDGFGDFSGFGSHRSMMSSIFGGRDPFDDPFFTRPFSGISRSSMFAPFGDAQQVSKSKGPVIEELEIDDEEEGGGNDTDTGDKKDRELKSTRSSTDPLVEHPDDQSNEKGKDVLHRSDFNRAEGIQTQPHSVSFRKVTYGGINGAYYTATTTRRAGSDGVVLEESKQADRTTGQAAHKISKGMHDKGHSVTRKLNSDGKVDTTQTLHNLSEDELTGFEQAWKGNAERHLPGWNDGSNSNGNAGASGSGQISREAFGGWALPFADRYRRTAGMGLQNEVGAYSSVGRPKKVVTINIE